MIRYKRSLIALVTASLAVTALMPTMSVASTTTTKPALRASHHSTVPMRSAHLVTHAQQLAVEARDRAAGAHRAQTRGVIPFRNGFPENVYAAMKAAALHNARAPHASQVINSRVYGVSPNTPSLGAAFEGMADSGFICQFFGNGCQPPDMAIAASPTKVLQGVNTSVAVFDPIAQVEDLGWPLSADAFLGGGPSAALGGCDPNGPFLSDPRAFYDPTTGRFFYAIAQIDGVDFFGDSCPDMSLLWVAVSIDGNPNDGFHAYSFDDSAGAQFIGDYPTFGYDDACDCVASGQNDFRFSDGGFQWSNILYLEKAGMEAGTGPTNTVLYQGINDGSIFFDTMQPALMQTFGHADPGVLYVAMSFNRNSGGGHCSTGCNGLTVFGVVNPFDGTFNNGAVEGIPTLDYSLAPEADTQFCSACIETLDTRISATPEFNPSHSGVLTWALETAANNGTQVVPSVLWGEEKLSFSNTGPTLTATTRQNAYIISSGDVANSFGTTAEESNGVLFVLTDVMATALYHGAVYAEHKNIDALNFLEAPKNLKKGVGPDAFDIRWGDYEAASNDGNNNIWLSSEYINGSGDWGTFMGRTK